MYEDRWLQSGSSIVEFRLLRVVVDRVSVRARHRWRTPATPVPGETTFRDLIVGRAPTALGRLIEDGAELLDRAVAAHRSSGRAAAARLRDLAARPPVLTDVSEWAVAEVATRLHLNEHTAAELLVLAVTLDEQCAEACKTERDPRTEQQRMADCLADLILRPGETGLPPMQAQLTITASAATLAGGDEPGEADGEPLPAAVVREIAYALGLLPRPTEETAAEPDSEPTAGAPVRAGVPADAPAVPDEEARDAWTPPRRSRRSVRPAPLQVARWTAMTTGSGPRWPTCSSPTGSPAPRWPPAPRSPSPTR